jgi:hypothetical protein
MKKPTLPKILDTMIAVVLAYRPKPKTKPARKRQRKARKLRCQMGLWKGMNSPMI